MSDSALTGPNQANIDRWLTFDDVGQLLGFAPSRVRQLVREHQLASVRRPELREQAIPADFLMDGVIVPGLAGTLTLLADHGFDDAEAIEWMYAHDETLPGRPIDALRENRGTEVRRRAQATG